MIYNKTESCLFEEADIVIQPQWLLPYIYYTDCYLKRSLEFFHVNCSYVFNPLLFWSKQVYK